MKRTALHLAAVLAAVCLLAGCSQTRDPGYADAYRAALLRYQGTSMITPEMTERFVAFFSHSEDAAGPDAAALYGDRFYFSDTLLTTEDRDVALQHLERMRDGAESLRVDVVDQQVDGQDVYLIWQMHMTFTPVTRTVTSNTIGITHLRFDDAGRIVLHQDFWDSAAGMYQHIPVVGGLIGMVRNRVSSDGG